MTAAKRCKRYIDNCEYCTTGTYKRPVRRRNRHKAKQELRNASLV